MAREFTGRLVFVDMGPGSWLLEGDDGQRRPLYGAVPDELRGQRVVVSGSVAESMGFGMTGGAQAVEVRSIRPA